MLHIRYFRNHTMHLNGSQVKNHSISVPPRKHGLRYVTCISKQICQDPHKTDPTCAVRQLRTRCASIDLYGV
jgi:hypothetical protein